MNETYGQLLRALTPPARTTVEVARLPRDVHIEIEAIAIDPRQVPVTSIEGLLFGRYPPASEADARCTASAAD